MAEGPCQVRSSNAGHLLMTGIAGPERARQVAAGLMDSRFFTGWGIRTLAADEARYNPMSYHNGSVWPHDNALIALGMARMGLREETLRLFDCLRAAAAAAEQRRLPELFCGFAPAGSGADPLPRRVHAAGLGSGRDAGPGAGLPRPEFRHRRRDHTAGPAQLAAVPQ